MGVSTSFIARVKRAETPFYRFLKAVALAITQPKAPVLPRVVKPVFRFMYELHFMFVYLWNMAWNLSYRHLIFQGRCSSFGRSVIVDRLPFVVGPVSVHVGDHVYIGGKVCILSAAQMQNPVLILKDHCQLGWNCTIAVNTEVTIEEYARVSFDCRITDNDGHPREADLRAAGLPPAERDMRPVRIGKYSWIGNGTSILKGVTIGEGAVVGANSVVVNDVPPYSLAMGNPARVVLREYGRPSTYSSNS